MGTIAFLPWPHVREAIEIGPLRLLPYARGKMPGELPNARQNDIDAVLSAYADRPHHTVEEATIVEFGAFQTGMDGYPLAEIFHARDLLAFSALAKRRLFGWHYCNTHTYALVVQLYEDGKAGRFAFYTRRRDGGASHVWGSSAFAFHRPDHVEARAQVAFDYSMLATLLSTAPRASALHEAILEFNAANTDSSDIPTHVGLVMLKSAFEFLLEIGSEAQDFVAALNGRLGDVLLDGVPFGGPWKEARPTSKSLLEAWAREFCALRGSAAHGKKRKVPSFVWTEEAHLAFGAIFFQLLLRKVLSDSGSMQIDNYEMGRLQRLQQYLRHDPFDWDSNRDDEHPWSEIESELPLNVWLSRSIPPTK